MTPRVLFLAGSLLACLAAQLSAGPLQRIGHLELPLIANNKGMYAAAIDSANGYAYFIGSNIVKLDISGSLPVQVGPAVLSGQFAECEIDPAAGYLYLPKNGSINRYALGVGSAAVTSAGSYFINSSTPASSLVIDDSDPNPANHYGYFMYSGTPATVYKIAMSTMTVVSSLTLNSGENNFAFGMIDAKNGYAYFGAWSIYTSPTIPQVIKIKLTPGTNAPIRIGIANLDTVAQSLWAHSIDTLHGYLYIGSDNGTTNPDTIYKVQLGTGDVAPMPAGSIKLHTGEFQLISSVVDPVGGYVYFGNDNTYPGRIFQILLNGPNPPVEIGFLQLQGGTSIPPPDGTSGSNTTGNGVPLPYGEVYLRSAVYDPVRGYAYFGQDSGPNQVVKVQLARDTPVITSTARLPDTSFQLHFNHTPYVTSIAWATTDLTQPLSSWTSLGATTEVTPGQFSFDDAQAGSFTRRFYIITSP